MLEEEVNSIHDVHHHSILVESREIFIHGYIGESEEDCGVDHRMAVRFLKNLRYLTN